MLTHFYESFFSGGGGGENKFCQEMVEQKFVSFLIIPNRKMPNKRYFFLILFNILICGDSF